MAKYSRKREKYPALKKSFNKKSRQDFIELDYINGVKDDKGNEVIRPLNDEELAFLNKYYEETIVTNFLHNDDIKKLSQQKKEIIDDAIIKDLKAQLEQTSDIQELKRLKGIIKLARKQNEEIYEQELYNIEKKLKRLRKKHLLYSDKEDHKTFYGENNSRNNCLFNKAKTYNQLSFLEDLGDRPSERYNPENLLLQKEEIMSYKYSQRSLDKISECHPNLQKIALELINYMDVTILCGHRSEEEQNRAYKKGTSKLKYPNSKHNKNPSEAIDISPYPIDWEDLDRFNEMCNYVQEIADRLGIKIRLGRSFSFRDYPHIELL